MKRTRITAPLADPRLRLMTAGPDGGEGAAGDTSAAPGGGSEQAGETPAPNDGETPAETPAEGDDEHGSTADDPKLKAARDEAAQNRIRAREAKDAADTAASKYDQLVQTLGKGLGLIKDDDGEAPAPDAEALAAAGSRSADEGHRVCSRAGRVQGRCTNGADPTKLLDSRFFLASIAEVDHGDEAALSAAIKAAVQGNQSFALGRVSGASTADTASGPGGGSAPKAEMCHPGRRFGPLPQLTRRERSHAGYPRTGPSEHDGRPRPVHHRRVPHELHSSTSSRSMTW